MTYIKDESFDLEKDLVRPFRELSKATGFCIFVCLRDMGETHYSLCFPYVQDGNFETRCGEFFRSLSDKFKASPDDTLRRHLIDCPCGSKAIVGTMCLLDGYDHDLNKKYWVISIGGIRAKSDEKRGFATFGVVTSVIERFNKYFQAARVVRIRDILNAIVKTAPVIIFAKDLEGKYILVNQAMCDFFGKEKEYFLGKTVFECYEREYAESYHASDMKVISSKQETRERITLKDGSGQIRVGFLVKRPLWDQNGEVAGVVGVFMDTTELESAREDLIKERSLLNSLINASPDLVCFKDAKSRWLVANRSCLDIFHLKGVDYTGKTDAELAEYTHPVFKEAFATCLISDQETLKRKKLSRFEERIPVLGEEQSRLFDIIKVPVMDDADNPKGILVIGRDITKMREAEEERLKIEKKLFESQRLESLGVLAGGIAHDFKNILAAIMGNAELAYMSMKGDQTVKRFMDGIITACERGRQIVSQMLSFAGGEGVEERSPMNLTEVAETNLEFLKSLIPKKATLQLDLKRDIPLAAINEAQMTQVLVNLLVNASEALPDGRGKITIRTGEIKADDIKLSKDGHLILGDNCCNGNFVFIEVSDTGKGMSEHVVKRIFDPFFSTKFHGRGMGLASVHGIVKQHSGCILVKSREGRGTTFRVILPASEKKMEDVTDFFRKTDISAKEEKQQTISSHELDTSEIEVLVVDDEDLVRVTLANFLEAAGCRVEMASNGENALNIIKKAPDRFHVIVLDLHMPVMDGKEVLEELRKMNVSAKVVLSTGFLEPKSMGVLKKLGVAAFVDKPYRMKELLKLIRELATQM